MTGREKLNENGKSGARHSSRPSNRRSTTSAVEWIVAAAGVTLLVVMLSYLLFIAMAHGEGAPVPVISHKPAKPGKAGFVVDYEIANEGKSAAAQLVVTGQLLIGDRVVEERYGLIDYVAQDSKQKGSLIFQRDPQCCRTMVSVSSFAVH